jgi:two-component system, sensor histidine kinase and response regulator
MSEIASRVLVADHTPAVVDAVSRLLEAHCQVVAAHSGAEALALALADPPDLILLDADMPDTDGYDMCRRLKTEKATGEVPVILLAEHEGPQREARALAAGAVDYISQPVGSPFLSSRVLTHLRVKEQQRVLKSAHLLDSATGLPNRRRCDEVLVGEWRRSARDRRALAVMLIDVDHLKTLIGQSGNGAGDQCLRRVARCVARILHRSGDFVGRFGPTQLLAILPNVSDAGSGAVAERVRRAVADLGILIPAAAGPTPITVTIGVASDICDDEARAPNLLALADERLATARRAGTDRWVGAAPPEPPTARDRRARNVAMGIDSAAITGKLLLVDDTSSALDVLAGLLGTTGCDIRLARSGLEALLAVGVERPDLILLDISMPELDGFEVCRRLKADPVTADLPVIFISALDEPMDKVRAFECGGADYVQKPFEPAEVLARIANQLKLTRLQADMRSANQRLQELDRLKATLTAMLVHDLRSPLTVVQLALSSLEEDVRALPGSAAELTSIASVSVEKILRLVNDMLEVYRTDDGPMSFALNETDPAPALSRAASLVRMEARDRGIAVDVDIEPGLPRIMGNEDMLDRALVNLLSNAVKFTPTGGRITLAAHGVGDPTHNGRRPWLRIEIADTGEGISASDVPHIFEPYWQAVSEHRGHGVGLGLAIVKRIVDGHRATITVKSDLGAGTRFTIDLPALRR